MRQRGRPYTHRSQRAAGAPALPRQLGAYWLFDTVGQGGMADLYLARDGAAPQGSPLVVIKEVELAHPAAAERRCMLLREARVATRLAHPNIVRVQKLGDGGTSLYLVMEYVEGLDLRELLRCCAARGMWPSLPLALCIIRELLTALDQAHRATGDEDEPAGVVHRDVSPANVLLGFAGEVKLCDFGIAAPIHPRGQGERSIQGKAGYMSPEQARGEPVDARADVFAAGIILWELCAKRRMYRTPVGERLLDVAVEGAVPELPARDLPRQEELSAIVRRALARRPDARYRTAAALRDALDQYAAQADLEASPQRLGRWLRQHFVSDEVKRRRARARELAAEQLEPDVSANALAPRAASKEARRYAHPATTFVLHAVISCAVTLALLWLVFVGGAGA